MKRPPIDHEPQVSDGSVARPDGSRRRVRTEGEGVRGEDGAIVGLGGVAVDITGVDGAQRALSESEARFRTLVEDAPVAIGVSRAGRMVAVNAACRTLFGFGTDEGLVGESLGNLIAPAVREQVIERSRRRAEGLTEPESYDTIGLRRDGSAFPMHVAIRMVDLPDGRAAVAFMTDLTERAAAQRAVAESEARLRVLFEQAPVAVGLSRFGRIIEVNDAYLRLHGYASRDELIGHSLGELIAPESRSDALDWAQRRAHGDAVPARYEATGLRRDGSTFPMHVAVIYVTLPDGPASVAFITDLTEIRRAEAARRDALTDPLTGIPNRRSFDAAVASRLEEVRRYRWSFGLLLAHIDHFKDVNDRYGHAAGDAVLRRVSGALAGGLRGGDLVYRWGGEEFAILVNDAQLDALRATADRLRLLVQDARAQDEGQGIAVRISLGGTVALPEDAAGTLIERADRALYRAKDGGRDRVVIG